jgi:tetratricopeptide (TPR) repeat protein
MLEAEQAYRQAFAIGEKLVAESPAVHYFRSRLATVATGLAKVLAATGRVAEAEAAYRRSIDLLKGVVAEFPDVTSMPEWLFRHRLELASLLNANGRVDDAKALYREALAVAPKDAFTANLMARVLCTRPEPTLHDSRDAVELADGVVKAFPRKGPYWNTLGVAQFRAGQYQEAEKSLETSMELRGGGDSYDWFFLAMIHWKFGDKDAARAWHTRAVEWMDTKGLQEKDLILFRAEAEALLELSTTTSDD